MLGGRCRGGHLDVAAQRDARLDRAEHFAKELGGPVGDLRLCGEAGFRGHEDDDFDDALDGRERTDLLLVAARAFSLHCRAAAYPASSDTAPPSLPGVIS